MPSVNAGTSTSSTVTTNSSLQPPRTRYERDMDGLVESLGICAKELIKSHFSPVDGADLMWEMPKKTWEHLKRHYEYDWLRPGFCRTEHFLGSNISFMGSHVVFDENRKNIAIKATRNKWAYGPLPDISTEDIKVSTIEILPAKISHIVELPYNPLYFIGGLQIHVKSRVNTPITVTDSERKAIETLRDMITEEEYRRYIKYGFILVRGASGAVYQISRSEQHTKVWVNGKVVEEVCVRISDKSIPPTDNVIAFKAVIESDEESFKKMGNLYTFKKAA